MKKLLPILLILLILSGAALADPPVVTKVFPTASGNTITLPGGYSLTLTSSGTLGNPLLSGTAAFALAAQTDEFGNDINSTYVSYVTTSSTATSGTVQPVAPPENSVPMATVSLTGSFAVSGTCILDLAELGAPGAVVSIHTTFALANLVVKKHNTTLETIALPANGGVTYFCDGNANFQRVGTNTTIGGLLGPVPINSTLTVASGTLGVGSVPYSLLTGTPTIVTTGSSSLPGITITISGTNVLLTGTVTAATISGTLPRSQVTLESYGTLSGSSTSIVTLSATGSQNFNTVTLASGSTAYTYSVQLSDSGVVAGDLYELSVALPASSNPTLNIYDSGTGGSPIATIPGNGTAGATTLSFVNTGTSWVPFKKGAALLLNNLSDLPSPATARANLGAAQIVGLPVQAGNQVVTDSTTLVSSTNCIVTLSSTGNYFVDSYEVIENSSTTGLSQSVVNFTGSATQTNITAWRVFTTSTNPNGLVPTFYDQTASPLNYNTAQANFGSNHTMIVERLFTLNVTGTGVLSTQFSMVTASGTADTATLWTGSYLHVFKQ